MEKKPVGIKNRESNIELLRIVLMLMIITHHLIVHSGLAKNALFISMDVFTIIAVNCFVFISGYYGIKFKAKTLLSFIVQAVFYSVATYLIYHAFISTEDYSTKELIHSFFPVTYVRWWFLSAFLGVYILSPFINKGIDSLNIYQSGFILIALLYLNCSYPVTKYNFYSGDGCTFFNLLCIYILARFCSKYIKDIKKPLILYICTYLLTLLLIYILLANSYADIAWRLIAYSSPLVILGAVLFFYTFRKIKIKSNVINKIAPLCFGVYLIHDTADTRSLIKGFIEQINNAVTNPLIMGLTVIGIAILIFIVCASIEKIRQIIFNPIIDAIDKKRSVLFLKIEKYNV
ncbi:acyltransferase family protein [Dysgonomonas alginatilytica]|nr:acyltransferase [Dysgonomonas alginatilytica]